MDARDYDRIFDSQPTFNEKKAFVHVFRQKWMRDQKHTSLFDRRSAYVKTNQERERRKQKVLE